MFVFTKRKSAYHLHYLLNCQFIYITHIYAVRKISFWSTWSWLSRIFSLGDQISEKILQKNFIHFTKATAQFAICAVQNVRSLKYAHCAVPKCMFTFEHQ